MKAFLFLLFALPASAAEAIAPVSTPTSLLQVVLGLGLVLALIVASGWLMRKMNPSGSSNGPIRVVTAASLGQRERVVLVEINETWLLLGVAPGQVTLLQSLPKAHAAEQPLKSPISFLDKLKQAKKHHEPR